MLDVQVHLRKLEYGEKVWWLELTANENQNQYLKIFAFEFQ